ncbi:hypothetical protein Srubr_80270 [Streptomyces rubradiris]|uniref:Glucose-1-phosphate thymidylyltransferase n=2 Tax=Streptomyces rubradiris TaxID=285531 RepID=A0ABQ3RQN7_STRRR|nr:hypothetical protein Srubr_80270 [Streptomyces rubradiris]
MKALVLAGGSGSRLRPLTLSMPKQLIPVANEPVLRHCLRNIRAMGIRQVGVVEGEHGDQIRAALGDGAALGLDLTYIRQDTPAGLAHCVRIAAGFLGNEDFVLYLGDNVVSVIWRARPRSSGPAGRPRSCCLPRSPIRASTVWPASVRTAMSVRWWRSRLAAERSGDHGCLLLHDGDLCRSRPDQSQPAR